MTCHICEQPIERVKVCAALDNGPALIVCEPCAFENLKVFEVPRMIAAMRRATRRERCKG